MSDYEVTLELVIYAPVKIRVRNVDGKEDAIEAASELVAGYVSDALASKNLGWKAKICLTPPPGIELAGSEVRATVITQSGGGEKAKRI